MNFNRFQSAYDAVAQLQSNERYEAAFIFGSVAEGTAGDDSDVDAIVIVNENNDCQNLNHPFIDNIKIDISFRSFAQLKETIDEQISIAIRQPFLYNTLIVFDKTGELTELYKDVVQLQPPTLTPKDYQLVQFKIYHANDKVQRFLASDPDTALYSMHANLSEILKIHYELHGQWWVSSKKVLHDLQHWDPALAVLLVAFLRANELLEKYACWTAMIDYITQPLGGRQDITENNCDCPTCQRDLAAFQQ